MDRDSPRLTSTGAYWDARMHPSNGSVAQPVSGNPVTFSWLRLMGPCRLRCRSPAFSKSAAPVPLAEVGAI